MAEKYDIAVIGAGSGGLVGARFAAQAGARVALIEKHRIGGDCTWTGCVPSKALIKAANVAHMARTASHFGLNAAVEKVNLKAVMDYVRSAIASVYQHESPETLRRQGIEVFIGQGRFTDAHMLAVTTADGPQTITAKNFVICTGGRPAVPDVKGLGEVGYITYEKIFDQEVLPEHLLVLGGGPIGIEMAQAFRRLGSEVTVFQSHHQLLPKDEPEAAEVLLRVLRHEGMTVHLNTRVTAAARAGKSITLQTDVGEATGDMLLVATGRKPNVDTLDLDKAGVRYTAKGVPVDEELRTNVKHIYAAGDVIGGPQFTHYAGYQAFIAARNALFPGTSKGIPKTVPWTTFTDPEIAHAGLTEAEARQAHGDADVGVRVMQMEHVDRAVTESDTAGFIKVVHKKDGAVLGATIVAERAGEIIQEWELAMARDIKMADLAGSIHVYPTYAIANQQLASAYSVESFLSGTAGKLLKRLSGLK
ncbi:MAG TPA: mercuric reductase [Blastocatellia bacterium]|nr:mercuric reductase [Blastocatellia bacterium]